MKKLSAMVLVLILLVSLALPLSAKGHTYRAAYGTAVLDGEKDEAYDAAQVIPVAVAEGTFDSYPTAEINILWDEKAVYMYVDVKDDTPSYTVPASLGDCWQTDCIEVQLNLGYDGESHSVDEVNCGIFLAAVQLEGQVEQVGGMVNDSFDKTAVKSSVKYTDNGWAVEFYLPVWGDVIPKTDDSYGFTSCLHFDNNDDCSRDGRVLIDDQSGEAYANTEFHETIILVGSPAPMTEAETAPAADVSAAAEAPAVISPATSDFGSVSLISMAAAAMYIASNFNRNRREKSK